MPVLELVPPREWPTIGAEALDWMEHYLCHGPGDVQGEPLFINEEAAQFVYDCYRLYPKGHERAGRRVVSYGCLSEPKGFAKSELAGALVCFELVGPCRFDGWSADGSPVGRPITYPFVRPLATEEGQTGNTYGNVMVMLEHARDKFTSEWRFGDLDIGSSRTYLGRAGKDGEVRPSTAGAASKDGGKESFCVADEPHLYILPELRQMHAMVRRNSVKRRTAQSWMMATTTMFEPGQDSVAEDLYAEAEKLQKAKRRSYSFCFHHRQGFDVAEKDKDDDALVLASLREAYAPVLDHMDPEVVLENEIRAPGSVWAENVRYFFNIKHQGESKAVDPIRWDELAEPQRTPTVPVPVVAWFDGSDKGKGNDHTVLGFWTVEEHPHCVLVDWWQPERDPKSGDWKINRRKVRAAVTQLRQSMKVQRFVCDPHKWNEQIDEWADEFGNDAKGEPIVLEFDTSRATRMGPAIDRIREGLDESAFTHDGSPQLRYYALNALVQPAKGAPKYHALAKEKESLKIDGFVGATLGYEELAHTEILETPTFFGAWS